MKTKIKSLKELLSSGKGMARQKYYINFDCNPYMPNRKDGETFHIVEHQKFGKMYFEKKRDKELYINDKKVELYLSAKRWNNIRFEELRIKLLESPDLRILNANLAHQLMIRPSLIPEKWNKKDEGTRIHFLGTVYSGTGGGLYIYTFLWYRNSWRNQLSPICDETPFDSNDFIVVL